MYNVHSNMFVNVIRIRKTTIFVNYGHYLEQWINLDERTHPINSVISNSQIVIKLPFVHVNIHHTDHPSIIYRSSQG